MLNIPCIIIYVFLYGTTYITIYIFILNTVHILILTMSKILLHIVGTNEVSKIKHKNNLRYIK